MSEVTSLLDILPTIAELVGVEKFNNPLDGVSLVSSLTGSQTRPKERSVFHFCDSEVFSVRRQTERGEVFKMILQEPELTAPQSGGCSGRVRLTFPLGFLLDKLFSCLEEFNFLFSGFICPCYGPNIRKHLKPLLYNIVEDPTENHHIDTDSETYKEISEVMINDLNALKEELSRTKMPSQFQSYHNILPVPWLQPLLYV